MKFTITREQLQEGLAAVAAAVPTKTTLPVLANVLVEASKQAGGLRLSGTDLDIAVSTTVPAEVDADGAVTLPAKKLVDIARELPSGPVRVTAAGEARDGRQVGARERELIYDGVLNASLIATRIFTLDLASGRAWIGFVE